MTTYEIAVLLGFCEYEFRNDPPLLHAIRLAVKGWLLEGEA